MKWSPQGSRESTGVTGGAALVIFGCTGNLATTRLIPAVLGLERKGLLPSSFVTLGVDRRLPETERRIPGFRFLRGDLRSKSTFSALGRVLRAGTGETGSTVIFYLATRPELFAGIVKQLTKEGLNASKGGRRVIMVEKPFGVDAGSAQVLERALRSAFPAKEIFRVDHFLGKEGTSQIRNVRLDPPRLESVWNSRFIDHVQVMADEAFDIGARGSFYDTLGVVRDMVQNHLLQLLCLVAMEPPRSSDTAEVARSRARVLRAVRVPDAREVVWGQYRGYSRADGVSRKTRTPTFVAMKVAIDSSRWRGVPFYLRTGKALARTATEVVVVFKDSARMPGGVPHGLSCLRICIDPAARVVFEAPRKAMTARHRQTKGEYEALLLDALRGNQARFVDAGFNTLSWRLFEPLLQGWEGTPGMKPTSYEVSSWGPDAADSLLAEDGRSWRDYRSSRGSN